MEATIRAGTHVVVTPLLRPIDLTPNVEYDLRRIPTSSRERVQTEFACSTMQTSVWRRLAHRPARTTVQTPAGQEPARPWGAQPRHPMGVRGRT